MLEETELKQAIGKIQSLVLPCSQVLDHTAAALVTSYATNGCPTVCGPAWSQDHIKAAIRKGFHSSTLDPDALHALHTETTEKIKMDMPRLILLETFTTMSLRNSRSPQWK